MTERETLKSGWMKAAILYFSVGPVCPRRAIFRFQEYRRTVQPGIRLSAGDDPQPFLLYEKAGRILPVLPE